uniref:Uncharacterized protein n=1 Tax=Arundo donax TaxID=35708 RepID=A0A0A9B790_ARUDO
MFTAERRRKIHMILTAVSCSWTVHSLTIPA